MAVLGWRDMIIVTRRVNVIQVSLTEPFEIVEFVVERREQTRQRSPIVRRTLISSGVANGPQHGKIGAAWVSKLKTSRIFEVEQIVILIQTTRWKISTVANRFIVVCRSAVVAVINAVAPSGNVVGRVGNRSERAGQERTRVIARVRVVVREITGRK